MVARRLMEENLNDEKQEYIEARLNEITEKIETLREDFAACLGVLLVFAGKISTTEEAKEWVEKTFYS